ncbi:hypothetical protein Zmor_012709 [Zophobas morio]|uniref:Uncharacterized protein n=1 Tax=Zophobas morio TaxID=2755281 RepID=A0AA38IGH1_9CUCU|nr:hypothetical protein Zmor_012709 [Zophobas morio]
MANEIPAANFSPHFLEQLLPFPGTGRGIYEALFRSQAKTLIKQARCCILLTDRFSTSRATRARHVSLVDYGSDCSGLINIVGVCSVKSGRELHVGFNKF